MVALGCTEVCFSYQYNTDTYVKHLIDLNSFHITNMYFLQMYILYNTDTNSKYLINVNNFHVTNIISTQQKYRHALQKPSSLMSKEASTWRCSMLRLSPWPTKVLARTNWRLVILQVKVVGIAGSTRDARSLSKLNSLWFATDTEDAFIAEVDTIEQISVLNLLVHLGLDLIHQSHQLDLLHHSLDLLCVLAGGLQSRVRDPISPNLTIWIPPTWPWVKTRQ